jgi:hypothetical protein
MDDITAPEPECEHRFKDRGGMLVCEMCGYKKPPRKQPALDIQPIGDSQPLDCSAGANFMKRQRRTDDFFKTIVGILRWW